MKWKLFITDWGLNSPQHPIIAIMGPAAHSAWEFPGQAPFPAGWNTNERWCRANAGEIDHLKEKKAFDLILKK